MGLHLAPVRREVWTHIQREKNQFLPLISSLSQAFSQWRSHTPSFIPYLLTFFKPYLVFDACAWSIICPQYILQDNIQFSYLSQLRNMHHSQREGCKLSKMMGHMRSYIFVILRDSSWPGGGVLLLFSLCL